MLHSATLQYRPFVAAFALLLLATAAHANTIAVFGDANMFSAFPAAGNVTVLDNLLGSGSEVVVSRQTAGFTPSLGIENHYGTLPGVTTTVSSAPITGGLLAGVDLLFLDLEFAQPSPYDAGEIAALLAFVTGGGSLALIAEHDSVADYNTLLTGVGSAIRFTGEPRCCDLLHNADTVLPTALTAGVAAFQVGAASPLTGGTAAVQDQDFTLVAFESIPEPGVSVLIGVALAVLAVHRRDIHHDRPLPPTR